MARKLPGRTDKAIKNHFMRSFDKTTDFKDRKHSKKRDYIDFSSDDVQSIARKLSVLQDAKVSGQANRTVQAIYGNNASSSSAMDEVLGYQNGDAGKKRIRNSGDGMILRNPDGTLMDMDLDDNSDSEDDYDADGGLAAKSYQTKFTKEEVCSDFNGYLIWLIRIAITG